MDKERIRQMAVEAGGVPMRENCLEAEAFPWGVEMEIDALERVIQAVARECKKIADDSDYGPIQHHIGDQISARFGLGE